MTWLLGGMRSESHSPSSLWLSSTPFVEFSLAFPHFKFFIFLPLFFQVRCGELGVARAAGGDGRWNPLLAGCG